MAQSLAQERSRLADEIEQCLLPLLRRMGVARFWQCAERLIQGDFQPREVTERRRLDALRRQAIHAADCVPFYRRRLRALAVDPARLSLGDWKALPVLTKDDVLASFPDQICSTDDRRTSWTYRSTSGTSLQIPTAHDREARDWRHGAYWRSLSVIGHRPGYRQVLVRTHACLDACGALNRLPASRDGDLFPRAKPWPPWGFSSVLLQEDPLPALPPPEERYDQRLFDRYLAMLCRKPSHLLRGLAGFTYGLALRLGGRNGARPRTDRIVVQDSLVTPFMKRVIGEAFGCPVRETYGSSEFGSMAAECNAGRLHELSDVVYLEAVGPDGAPVSDGETGRFLVTTLRNRAMPLLRYEIGDLGRIMQAPCPCGRTTRTLEIEGRSLEVLETARGRLTARRLCDLVLPLPGVRWFQFVCTAGRCEELLVAAEPEASRFRPAWSEALAKPFAGDVPRIRIVDQIPPGKSGKPRMVKHV